MKLNEDKIMLESRSDIDVMQTMIDNYLFMQGEKQMLDDTPVEELKKLSEKLSALWYCW